MQTRSRERQRGASMVEAAFVTPVFFLLIFSVFEMGFLLRNYIMVTSASGNAARAAAVAGSNPDADFLTIQSVNHALGSFNLQDLDVIVVYKATGPGDTVPLECLSVPVPAGAECNRYTAQDFFLSYVDNTGTRTPHWGCGAPARDDEWCPLSRNAAISGPPDYVGIYIGTTHRFMTGFFGSTKSINVNRIARIEPSVN